MKKLMTFAALMLLTVLSLSACTSNKKKETTNETTENMKGKKVLVAYFSWSGNTKDAAQYIAQRLGADEFEIIREKPYPTEYDPCTEDAKAEKEANERPVIKGAVENMAQYDVVFVGVPVWWYTAPMPVFTFLEQYDLKGKTVIPFTTHEGSGLANCVENVKDAFPGANVRKGFSIYGHEVRTEKAKVEKWINGLK